MRTKSLTFGSAMAALLVSACSQSDNSADAAADATAVITDSGSTAGDIADYDGPIPMPIKVGTDGPDADACAASGVVTNLDEAGYASVRDAPSTSTKERDRLEVGQLVSICAQSGDWTGVVYSKAGDEATDCGTGSPVATEQNYTGPCRQGWVESRYVDMTAG